MLHLGVADCVGQKPVVNTRTNKSTPLKFTLDAGERSRAGKCEREIETKEEGEINKSMITAVQSLSLKKISGKR